MCVAIPGQVVSIADPVGVSRPGRVSVAGAERDVDLSLVPEAEVGDYVVTHSGYAVSVVPEASALETISMLGLAQD